MKHQSMMLEILDRGTFMPVLVTRLWPANEAERYLLGRVGYGRTAECQGRYVALWKLTSRQCVTDPQEQHNPRTGRAHQWIIDNWETLQPGDVVDIEFIAGEAAKPKESESTYTTDGKQVSKLFRPVG